MWQPGCRRGGLLALVIVAATLSLMWAVPEAAAIANDPGLWATPYSGPGNGVDQAAAIAARPDGAEVFVTGTSDGGPSLDDYATIAYDAASGTQLWVARYDGQGQDGDTPAALGISPDGSKVFVTGGSWGPGQSSQDFATVAYDAAAGTQLWLRRYNGPHGCCDSASAL